jgi:hypothetical protein
MVDGPRTASGWVPWKPVVSPVTEADIQAVEKVIGAPLPPLFRAWLTYKCLLMTNAPTYAVFFETAGVFGVESATGRTS